MILPLGDLVSSLFSLLRKGLLRMLSMAKELENLVPGLVSLVELLVLMEEDGDEGVISSLLEEETEPWLAVEDGIRG